MGTKGDITEKQELGFWEDRGYSNTADHGKRSGILIN